jgi:pimeloyl-ACP methyl ester carboxylesterase
VLAVAAVINDPASPHLGFGQGEAAAAIATGTDDAWRGITRAPVEIPMDGGWSSRGELTYPSGATGPLPTVVLLHGSGKNDRDQTLAPDVATLATVARSVNHAGYAVLRFDKRGVVGVGPVLSEDPAQLNPERPYQQILRDAAAAIRFAQDDEHVDADRLFLLGHSEGTQVASNLAADPHGYGIVEPAGVIAMGVVGAEPREVLYYQAVGRWLERLHERFDADHDGRLTAAELTDGVHGRPEDPAATLLDGDRVNGQVDGDGDGRLGIDDEVERALRATTGFDQYPNLTGTPPGFGAYLEDIARFPNVVEDLPGYAGPVLLLNGQDDIQTPARLAVAADTALGVAGHPDHNLIIYPGMSHLMNLTDKFDPAPGNPDPVVLADITRWLGEHS